MQEMNFIQHALFSSAYPFSLPHSSTNDRCQYCRRLAVRRLGRRTTDSPKLDEVRRTHAISALIVYKQTIAILQVRLSYKITSRIMLKLLLSRFACIHHSAQAKSGFSQQTLWPYQSLLSGSASNNTGTSQRHTMISNNTRTEAAEKQNKIRPSG